MSEIGRGNYRAISCVLLNEPEYRKLAPQQKLVLITLRLSLGRAQIGIIDAAEAVLAAKTGIAEADVRGALAALSAGRWICREGNVLWVVNGLKEEPILKVRDRKHRLGVQREVAGLPRLAIVDEFRAFYPDWFSELAAAAPNQSANPAEEPSEGLVSSFEAGERDGEQTETETERETDRAASIIRAVNRGVQRNPLIRPPKNDLSPSPKNLEAAKQLDGIPLSFILEAAERRAANYSPTDKYEQPTSLTYFLPGLKEDWAKEQSACRASAAIPRNSPVSAFCPFCDGRRVGNHWGHTPECPHPEESAVALPSRLAAGPTHARVSRP